MHKVTDFTDFSSVEEEQSGHFFPFQISGTGKVMTVSKNGVTRADKTDMEFDPDWVLRVEPGDEFRFLIDGKPYINLNFEYSTFE